MPKKTSPSKPTTPSVSDAPSTIKWAKGLSIFQIVVGVLALAFFIWLFSSTSMDPFVQGMQQGVIEEFNAEFSFATTPQIMGGMTALFALSLVGPILILVAISRRTKNWAIASLVFNGLLMVTNFSLVTIAIVVLMLLEPSRKYLNFNNV